MQPCPPSITSEAGLRQELYARTLEIDEPYRFVAASNEHRWRLASAFQKSVRRGHVHCAVKFSIMLWSIDPVYAWRRAAIVALEDCFGDPLACALAVEANHSFRFRQRLGEMRTLAAVVTGLAEGVKSRALTDSLVARGQGYQHPPARAFKAHVESYEAMPWLLTYLTRHGLAHAQLGYEIPVVWPLLDDAKIMQRTPDPLGDELIARLPAAAWDMFTREGLQALRYLKACKPFRPYTPAQIGLCLFYVEGGHLDRCLGSTELAALDLSAKLVDYVGVGFTSSEQAVELKRVINEKRELVNYARRRVLQCE
jgi:hypothetical protein